MKIAIIPARGGSKRIPRKNIKMFNGKPIIAYSIIAAHESNLFDHIIVSTDDEEIAQIAQKYGAEVPFLRPKNLADDYTGTNAVVKHALQFYIQQDISIDLACCIYATAPFVRTDDLKKGFELLVSSQKQYVFSVAEFAYPIQRAVHLDENKALSIAYPEKFHTRSQDLPRAYHDAGQFYWGQAQAFLQDMELFSEHSAPVILPHYLVQDIDTMDDWQRAELMYSALNKIC